jgi:hypothetical protein
LLIDVLLGKNTSHAICAGWVTLLFTRHLLHDKAVSMMSRSQEQIGPFTTRTIGILIAVSMLIGGCRRPASTNLEDAIFELEARGAEVALSEEGAVSAVKLVGFDLKDADLQTWTERLGGLQALEELDVRGAMITDAAVDHLNGLTRLESLGLADTGITDDGIADLKHLTKLKSSRSSPVSKV